MSRQGAALLPLPEAGRADGRLTFNKIDYRKPRLRGSRSFLALHELPQRGYARREPPVRAWQIAHHFYRNNLRDHMNLLLALILTVMSGAALAQTTGMVNPSPAPAEPSVKEDEPPPGGCMPIGLTVSGEMVFPIQCKEFIERHRGKAVEQKPSAVEEKAGVSLPAWANSDALVKPAQTEKQSEGEAPENSKPAIKPVETVPLPKRVEDAPRERAKIPDDRYCSEHYRSYDPASRTYMSYDGQRRSCR